MCGASMWPLRYGTGNIRDIRDLRPERESLDTVSQGGGRAVPPRGVPSVPARGPSGPQSSCSGKTGRLLAHASTGEHFAAIELGHAVAGDLRAARVALTGYNTRLS
ncbi:hypothetical protein NN561_008796 [Cricetulus griseus]